MTLRSPAIALIACLLGGAVAPSAALGATCASVATFASVDDLLKQAEKSIYVVKFDQALGLLDEAEARVPCVGEVVAAEALTRLFLYRGVVAFNQNNEVGSVAAFRRALAIDSNLRWNERFGQRPREFFLEAKGAVISEAPGALRLPTPAEDVRIYLNGAEMGREGGELTIAAGRHLLQVFQGEALLEGTWVDVPSGGVVQPALPRSAGTWPTASDSGGEGGGPRVYPSWFRPAGLGVMAAGGVALLTGAGGGVLYLQSKSALLNGEFYANRDDEEKDTLLLRNQRAALITTVALPAGAVLAGAGAALFILGKPDPALSLGPGALKPQALPGWVGLSFDGRF